MSSSVAEPRRAARASPSGSARSRRSAAPAPRSTPTRSRRGAPRRAARRRCRSGLRSASAPCRAARRAPRRWPNRCSASAASAARRRAARRASRRARSRSCARREITSSQNVGQRRFGSTPSSSTRSRPPPGSEPAENASAGHWISRITPSTSSTVGRAAWKSRYSSVSSVANTPGADGPGEPAHAVAGGVGRVVPARERGDERRAPERGLRVPADRHAITLRVPCSASGNAAYGRTTGLRSVPSPPIEISTMSPFAQPARRRARRADARRGAGQDDVAGFERAGPG